MAQHFEDMLQGEADMATFDEQGRRSNKIGLPTLLPWQRFVLATLLFLNVTVIGLLLLVMLGRFQLR